MSAIRHVLITAALGLAMIAFLPVNSHAQSTSNPSTAAGPQPGIAAQPSGSASAPPPSTTAPAPNSATGQPPASGVGSVAPQTAPPARNRTVTPDENAVGSAGQTRTTYVPVRQGHTGIIIALIVLAAIIVLAFAIVGQNRQTNVRHDRIG